MQMLDAGCRTLDYGVLRALELLECWCFWSFGVAGVFGAFEFDVVAEFGAWTELARRKGRRGGDKVR